MSVPNNYLQPVLQSELSREGQGFDPLFNNPSSGLILRSSLWNLPLTASPLMSNLRWDGIRWTTQNIGWTQVRSALFNSGAQFWGFGVHYLASGAPVLIQQVGTQVQQFDPTVPGYTETVLFTASSQSVPSMTSFSPNFFIYTNGVDHPQTWNGVTWSALSLFPFTSGSNTYDYPNLCESFNNRVAYAGFQNQPNAVMISDFGNPNSCTIIGSPVATNGGLYFTPSKLGPITSLRQVVISQLGNAQALLVGCQNGLCFINGTDGTSFSMVPVTDRFGIVSNRGWFALDAQTFGLCTDGIRPFNANTVFSNLITGAVTFPVQPLIQSMTTTAALQQQAFVLDCAPQLEATFYYSSNADVNNRTGLIMNYSNVYSSNSMMFSQKSFPAIVSGQPLTIFSPSCGVRYKGNYYAGGYNGILQKLYTNNTWNSTGIQWQYQSPMFLPNQVLQAASARGFWIVFDGVSPTFQAQATIWSGQARDQNILPTQTVKQTLSPSTGGGTKLGSWVLGQSSFGGSQPIIVPYYPKGAGHAWQIGLGGNTSQGDANLIGIYGVLNLGGTRN